MRPFLFLLLFTVGCHAEKFPVDITLCILDLKYNSEQGVKICEVQGVFRSALKGHHEVYGKGCINTLFRSVLQNYEIPVWFGPGVPLTQNVEEGVYYVRNVEEIKNSLLFQEQAAKPLKNAHSIADYQGIICYRFTDYGYQQFCKKFPGMLVLNAAGRPFRSSKHLMNPLFKGKKELEDLKPISNVYNREYSSELVDRILQDIPGEYLVIKPPSSAYGWGVIFIPREEFEETLKLILIPDTIPNDCSDAAIKFWKSYSSNVFIVEQFIPSDTFVVNGKRYDPTMRAMCVLIYDNQIPSVEFLGGYWKLPYESLDDEGDFGLKHKSKTFGSGYFFPAKKEVLEKVEEQLKAGLPYLHLNMLEVKN